MAMLTMIIVAMMVFIALLDFSLKATTTRYDQFARALLINISTSIMINIPISISSAIVNIARFQYSKHA